MIEWKAPRTYDEVMKHVPPQYQSPKDTMTCNGCKGVEKCPFAWDPYNTDGDCLAMK